MNCFPCFQKKESNSDDTVNDDVPIAEPKSFTAPPPPVNNNLRPNPPVDSNKSDDNSAEGGNFAAKVFNFRELATATKNFRQECLLGEGGFGRVFRGTLMPSGQIVAVRQLDRNGTQGSKEFQVEVSSLSQLNHPNLVKLIGYCADGEQRILVYEYVPSGCLKNHLFEVESGRKPLDWTTRMKIASGIAQGLEYLHERAEPPIIYRDLKSSNVLLDEANNPRLSEYGLAKLVQGGNKMHAAPSVMAASGYCAPECERHGESTVKSDVYSFGVILLELITGRRALDVEQSLVSWAQPIYRDPTKFPEMADPNLRNDFPVTSLNQAVGVAAMCLQEEPLARPLISDVSAALAFLAMAQPEAPIPARLVPILSSRVDSIGQFGDCSNSTRSSNFSSYHKRDHSRRSNSSDDEDEEDGESPASMKRKGKIHSSSSLRRSNSRSSGRRSNSSDRSSIDSREYSLRCDSNVRSLHSNSRQDVHEGRDDDSSSDDEWNGGGYNSNCSRQESRATSIGSNSFKHSRSNSGKISSRKYYHDVDRSMRSEDGPELTDSESDEDSDR